MTKPNFKQSLKEKNPKLASEWDYEKNGDLGPEDVSPWDRRKVWWKKKQTNPRTKKTFELSWCASIEKRTQGADCPYLTGRAVCKGFNDLASNYPEIASEWDYEKNGNLKPEDVTCGSGKKVAWKKEYTDHKTGKTFVFRWEAAIEKRVKGQECPQLTGKKVEKGFNDLASNYPEIAEQWHQAKNGDLKPDEVFAYSRKKVFWQYHYTDPKTGKEFVFEWDATIASRVRNPGCPFLSGQRLWEGFNDLASVHPELAEEWDYENNGELVPEKVMANSRYKAAWHKIYTDPKTGEVFDFTWKASVCDRSRGYGCPYPANEAVWPGFNDLATKAPELAAEWDYNKNRKLLPSNVTFKSNRKVWWKCPYCGKSYRTMVSKRAEGQNCSCMQNMNF